MIKSSLIAGLIKAGLKQTTDNTHKLPTLLLKVNINMKSFESKQYILIIIYTFKL